MKRGDPLMPMRVRQPSSDIEDLLAEAEQASGALMVRREGARDSAVAALRALEERMQAAIAGDTLRGLSDLAYDPTGRSRDSTPLQAANIYGDRRYGIDAVAPVNGKPTLVWTKDAVLALMWRVGVGVETRPVGDEELTAQDLEPAMRAAHTVLERHVMRAEKTHATYERVDALAKKVLESMGGLSPAK